MPRTTILRLAVFICLGSLHWTHAHADPKSIDVPPGDLATALESFAKQAGVEIDRIRAAIGARDLKINATGQTLGRLTFSAGVSELGVDDDGSSAMLKRADVSLYEAKRKGRNQVVIAA